VDPALLELLPDHADAVFAGAGGSPFVGHNWYDFPPVNE
jgi:hypothetical protein